jgi:hypothetical protein
MFDPTRLGVDLFVFLLIDADYLAGMIEDHETGTGGTLIYCG